ncbi:plasmid partitioning protein RepA [Microvirga ossetica]|uniref:plasmid partitioning protein RepA n=1 Tax=Microvirga ossetica TaxID=1882682 RepID=UPI000C1476C8
MQIEAADSQGGPSVEVGEYAAILRSQLQAMTTAFYPPTAHKSLRKFTSGEAAKILGLSDSRLRQLSIEGNGPQPEITPTGRRFYTLSDLHALREYLDQTTKAGRTYSPRRRPGEDLQVISVVNFKGGSGKTTTSAHLAQYLVLKGYRVLAIDLDPQASLSALLGIQPELEVGPGETLYGAIRYDDEQRPLRDVIRPTYFTGLDLIAGNLELMEFEHETPKALVDRAQRDAMFFTRVAQALETVADDYDVVIIDCPPQLGFLTLSALCAATSLLITVHPQMLDVASMSQFLTMMEELLDVVREAGGAVTFDNLRFLVTRYEPQDGPQTRITAMLRNLFGEAVLTSAMVKSSAVSDAGLTKQTLYEVGRESMNRQTYDRAIDSLDAVNGEIEAMIRKSWGRKP